MAILCKNSSGYKALGFWVEHQVNSDEDLGKYVVSIDDLEAKRASTFSAICLMTLKQCGESSCRKYQKSMGIEY